MWCATNYWVDRNRLSSVKRVENDAIQEWLVTDDWFAAALNRQHFFLTSTIMIRKQVFDRVEQYDSQLPSGQDVDLWWRIALSFPKSGFYTAPLARYREQLPNSLSSGGRWRQKSIVTYLTTHLEAARRPTANPSYRECVRFWSVDMCRRSLGKGFPDSAAELQREMPRDWIPNRLRWLIKIACWAPGMVQHLARYRRQILRRFR